MVISVARGLVVISAAVIIMGKVWGMNGVWLSFPVTELLTFFLAFILYRRFERTRPPAQG